MSAPSAPLQLYAVERSGPVPLAAPPGGGTVHDLLASGPPAVYSGTRTFHHDRFLWLHAHLDRIEDNLARLGWRPDFDRRHFCRALHAVVTDYPLPDARVRFDVSEEGTLIALSPFVDVPERLRREGVRVAVTDSLRRERPRIKTTDFVAARSPYPLLEQECYEHVMADAGGNLLEGTSSNFFGVRDGAVRTAGAGVLEGITRKILLHLARELGVPVALEPVHRTQVGELDEAFLTSSTRALVPIVEVGGVRVGSGVPGPVTERLLAAYEELAEREARPAIETQSARP